MAKGYTAQEAILSLMADKGLTNAAISKMLKVTPQTMYERLHKKKGMRVDTLCGMLAPLQYKVVIVPASKTVSAGEFELK